MKNLKSDLINIGLFVGRIKVEVQSGLYIHFLTIKLKNKNKNKQTNKQTNKKQTQQ